MFLIGVVLALILGALSNQFVDPAVAAMVGVLMVLGLVTGIFSMFEETKGLMYTSLVIVLAAWIGGQAVLRVPLMGTYLTGALNYVVVFTIPVLLVLAVKRAFSREFE